MASREGIIRMTDDAVIYFIAFSVLYILYSLNRMITTLPVASTSRLALAEMPPDRPQIDIVH